MLRRTQIAQLNNSHCSLFLNNLEMWTNALHFFQWQISMSTDGWHCSLTSFIFSWKPIHCSGSAGVFCLPHLREMIAQRRSSIIQRMCGTQRIPQTPDIIVIKSKYLNYSISGPHLKDWCDWKSFHFLIYKMKIVFFFPWYGDAINIFIKQTVWP